MIPAAASETSVDPARWVGRPPAFTPAEYAAAASAYPASRSRRRLADRLYARRAAELLGDDPAAAWARGRVGVLVELGRIPHPDDVKAVAAAVCRGRPATTRVGAALVRRARLGRATPLSVGRAATLVIRLLNAEQESHLRMSSREWLAVLERVRRAVKDHAAKRRAERAKAMATGAHGGVEKS